MLSEQDQRVSDEIESRDRTKPVIWATKYIFPSRHIENAGKKQRAVGSYSGDYRS